MRIDLRFGELCIFNAYLYSMLISTTETTGSNINNIYNIQKYKKLARVRAVRKVDYLVDVCPKFIRIFPALAVHCFNVSSPPYAV